VNINFIIFILMVWSENEMGRTFSMHAYNILVGKPEGKRQLGSLRHRWEESIRMDLKETGEGGADWIHLAQDRDQWQAVVNMVMNLWVL
jgi:hypothetical protein